MNVLRTSALAIACLALFSFCHANASFTVLPPSFTPKALSKDGAVIVGQDVVTGKAAMYVNGVVTDLSGADSGSIAMSCDRHGAIIVGKSGDDNPFKWTSGGGFVRLTLLPASVGGEADLISADGRTIVGTCDYGYPQITEFASTGPVAIHVGAVEGQSFEGFVGASLHLTCISDDGTALGGDASPVWYQRYDFGSYEALLQGDYAAYEQNWINYTVNAYTDDMGDYSVDAALGLGVQDPLLFIKGQTGWVRQFVAPVALSNNDEGAGYFERIQALFNGDQSYYESEYLLGLNNGFSFYDSDFQTSEFAYQTRGADTGVVSFSRTGANSTAIAQGTGFEVSACSSDGSLAYGRDVNGYPSVTVNGTENTFAAFLQAHGLVENLGTGGIIACSSDGNVVLGYMTGPSPQYWVATLSPQADFITVAPDEVQGGMPATGYAALEMPSEPFMKVFISADNSHVVPSTTAFLSTGQKNASFLIPTRPVLTDTLVHVAVSMPGKGVSLPLLVTAAPATMPALSGVSFTPNAIVGGHGSTCRVQFAANLPSSGALVQLSSGNTGLVKIPATATVAGGASSASVAATTTPVAAATVVNVRAVYGAVTKIGSITVLPAYIQSVTPSVQRLYGGTGDTAQVLFSGLFTSPKAVTLMSSNSAALNVPSGFSATGVPASFAMTTKPVDTDAPVTVSATCNGVTRSCVVTVLAPVIHSIAPASSTLAVGAFEYVTVTISGPCGPSGAPVTVLSANPAQVAVTQPAAILPGKLTTYFKVTGKAASGGPVTITVGYKGSTYDITVTVQ